MSINNPQLEHVFLPTNGIRLHIVQSGSRYSPLVILLHGFPEFWYGWQRQIQPLVEAGFRVWAPDQRGYNLSDKPLGISSYRLDELEKDVIGLINAAGVDKCYLVGHDWGAATAWWVAVNNPERIHRMAVLNMPHPSVMIKTLLKSPQQLRRSWYVFFFQIPHLSEAILRNNDFEFLVRSLKAGSKPDSFNADDLNQYLQAWWRKGAITGMLNWYRAGIQMPPDIRSDQQVKVPTLILWGAQDIALGREMAQPSLDLCEEGRLVFFENAGHWVQHDSADAVNKHLIEFFSSSQLFNG